MQFVQIIIVPTHIGNTGDKPGSAIVRQNHAVGFQSLQDDPGFMRVAKDVKIGSGAGVDIADYTANAQVQHQLLLAG